jgi:hypothetical protein
VTASSSPAISSAQPGPSRKGANPPGLPTILALLALAGLGGLALIVTTNRGRRPANPRSVPNVGQLQAVVQAAVSDGRHALDSSDDVGVALRRCYLAMHYHLRRAGLPDSPVRTPSELLRQVADLGLLPIAPAEALTRLFERARFSSDALTEADLSAAREALHSLGLSAASS